MAAKRDTSWFRRLADNRLEIFLKHGERKIRAHGPEAEMFELVEWFEDHAGIQVQGPWRRPPRHGPRQIEGQQSFEIPVHDIAELQSGDEVPEETPA